MSLPAEGATPQRVIDGLWIVDAAPISAGGLPLPVRMVVVRLASGALMLHSPVQYSQDLERTLEPYGPIRHLVLPSVGHWMFAKEWTAACPGVTVWAAPGLRDRLQVRAAGLRIDHELADEAPEAWSGELDQVLVRGPVFAEVDFFHRPSRTLLLTDLVVNLDPARLGLVARLMAQGLGITAPEGQAAAYVRLLLLFNRRKVARTAARLVALEPERVIFAHGRWFEHDATKHLRHALRWILGPAAGRAPQASHRRPAAVTIGVIALIVGLITIQALKRRRVARR